MRDREIDHELWLEATKVVEQLRNTSGTKAKEEILKGLEGDLKALFLLILDYTYNTNKIYNIGKAKVKGIMELNSTLDIMTTKHINYFSKLDELAGKSGVNDEYLKSLIKDIVFSFPLDTRELAVCILLKDLKIGMNIKSINKVFPKLLPQFDVQLATKYEKRIEHLVGEEITVTIKEDGVRGVVMLSPLGDISSKTRQNKAIEGIREIENEILNSFRIPKGIVLDGEFVYNGKENITSAERYRKTMEIIGSKDNNKENLDFIAFDIVDYQSFINQEITKPYKERRRMLEEVLVGHKLIRPVERKYQGTYDETIVSELLQEALDNDQEGVMININNAPYDFKRSNNLIKVKKMYTVDLKITGYEEGADKYEGMLGAILVDYKGYSVGVGSGFKDHERVALWEHPEEMVGKIVEIQYFEESTNKKDDSLSLRFPIFKGFRDDKDEVSYD